MVPVPTASVPFLRLPRSPILYLNTASSGHDVTLVERPDLVRRVADLTEYGICILSLKGSGSAYPAGHVGKLRGARVFRKAHRHVEHARRTGGWVLDRGEQMVLDDVRLINHVVPANNGNAGASRLSEDLNPLVHGPLTEQGSDDLIQIASVPGPVFKRSESTVAQQVISPQGPAERAPLFVGYQGHIQVLTSLALQNRAGPFHRVVSVGFPFLWRLVLHLHPVGTLRCYGKPQKGGHQQLAPAGALSRPQGRPDGKP